MTLRAVGATAKFEVRDDGEGFDPPFRNYKKHVLENFSRRARELDAKFVVDSASGKNTRINLSSPSPF